MFHEESHDIPSSLHKWRPSTLELVLPTDAADALSGDGQPIDLVITLGGDGTVLRVSSLFSTGPVPPVLSFSMGTLGFLLPFRALFSSSRPTALIELVFWLARGVTYATRTSMLSCTSCASPVLAGLLCNVFLCALHMALAFNFHSRYCRADIGSFETAIQHVFLGQATVLPRMRLACKFYDRDGLEFDGCGSGGWQVMNEVTLHRGRSPHLTTVDSYVDGQHLTEAVVSLHLFAAFLRVQHLQIAMFCALSFASLTSL